MTIKARVWQRLLAGLAAGAGGAAMAALALAQTPAQVIDAAGIYDARCKSCHEPAVDRAPGREELSRRSAENILDAITRGEMAPMAKGLTPAELNALAIHVAGKPFARTFGAGGAVGEQPADKMCATHPPIRATASDWNGFGKDGPATRFQPTTGLNTANVERLQVKWTFAFAGGRVGQPTVIGDHLFFTTYGGYAFSLDARTGCVHWRFKLGEQARTSPIVSRMPGVGDSGWVVFVGDRNRDVFALDAQTGRELWKTNVEVHPRGLLTGSPVLHDGVIYVPTSSSEETIAAIADYPCCTFTGSVVAIEARTGQVKWKTPMLPPAQPTRKNPAGNQMYGPAGSAIWSQPSIDARRGLIYVATGDSYTEAPAPTSDAIVAIEMATGRIRWVNQLTENDNFLVGCGGQQRAVNCPLGPIGPDVDFGASPILANLRGGRQIILAGQKSGVAWGIDPDSGKTLWETKVGYGSANGGIEWGMAYDGRRLFVAMSDINAPRDRAKPGLSALDPATGRIEWFNPAPRVGCSWGTRQCNNAHSAPPTAIPGVVFAGSFDGWLRAYATATGRTLWMHDTAGRPYATTNGVPDQPGGGIDATGPVVAGSMLYIVSGYSGATGAYGNPLNVLIAYSLDGR